MRPLEAEMKPKMPSMAARLVRVWVRISVRVGVGLG